MTPERLSFALCNLRLKQAFNLSKASATEKTTLIVRYGNGIGEGSPSIHYGYPAEKIKSILETEMLKLPDHRSLKDISQFAESLPSLLNVGRCAIEMALLDFEAKRNQLPLYQFLSLPRPGKISSSFTVTTGNEKELKQQMEIAQQFDSIKVKVGFADDIKFIDQLMKMGDFKLRLDANGGWSVDTAIEKIKSLAGYPVEFVEQPITEPRLMELDKIKTKVDCKIFLDESIMLFSDIEKFAPLLMASTLSFQGAVG